MVNRNEKILKSILLIIISVFWGVLIFIGMQTIKVRIKASHEVTGQKEISTEQAMDQTEVAESKPVKVARAMDYAKTATPFKVKGIYVTGPRAGSDEEMEQLIHLLDRTELNAMVIDIKNDSGEITYKMDSKMVRKLGAGVAYIHNMKDLIKRLKKKNIYLIARIVAFKDPLLAGKRPDLCLKTDSGRTFKDDSGLRWVNPYKKEVWDYLMEIAKEAVELGFDEIQFDYIRFSTDKGIKNVNFGEEAKGTGKEEIITQFTKYAHNELSPLGVFVSADVFGIVISGDVDCKIVGQNYSEMAKNLDYICPMIYPSHYANGSFQIQYPDLEPYNLILKVLKKSKKVLSAVEKTEKVASVRPWLQDFTATWLSHHLSYKENEIKAQIKAVYDAGYEEWIFWNGSNQYTKGAFLAEN